MSPVEARHRFRYQLEQTSSYVHVLIQLTIFHEALKDAYDLLTACMPFLVSKAIAHLHVSHCSEGGRVNVE